MSFDLWDSPNGASFQCSSNDICWVATDGNGGKLIAFDGQYTYGHYLPESEQAAGPDGNYPWLTSSTLACPGDDYCITADNRGYTMVFAGDASSNQHLGTPRQVDPSGSPVTVGCTSKESCFAVARNAQQYFRLQLGNTWSPAPLPGFATAESGYPRISCTPGLCVLLYAHRVSTYNGKRWSPTVTLPALAKGEAYAIGCSHTFCLASSSSATWIYEAGHWSRDRHPGARVDKAMVGCSPTSNWCLVVSPNDEYQIFSNGRYSTPKAIPTGEDITGVSCPDLCRVLDRSNQMLQLGPSKSS